MKLTDDLHIHLPTWLADRLDDNDISTVQQLLQADIEALKKVRGIGQMTILRITEFLNTVSFRDNGALSLTELSTIVYNDNLKRGFDARKLDFGKILALIHSEVSEALEADRKSRRADRFRVSLLTKEMRVDLISFRDKFKIEVKDTVEDELADAVIRIMDYCGAMKIDLSAHIEMKLEYNRSREFKHGKNY